MSVLVTGGAGYIGGHMTLGLVDAGETVVVIDNLSTGFAWAVQEPAKLVVGDFGDSELVARLIEEHRGRRDRPFRRQDRRSRNRSAIRSAITSTTPPRRATSSNARSRAG